MVKQLVEVGQLKEPVTMVVMMFVTMVVTMVATMVVRFK